MMNNKDSKIEEVVSILMIMTDNKKIVLGCGIKTVINNICEMTSKFNDLDREEILYQYNCR